MTFYKSHLILLLAVCQILYQMAYYYLGLVRQYSEDSLTMEAVSLILPLRKSPIFLSSSNISQICVWFQMVQKCRFCNAVNKGTGIWPPHTLQQPVAVASLLQVFQCTPCTVVVYAGDVHLPDTVSDILPD